MMECNRVSSLLASQWPKWHLQKIIIVDYCCWNFVDLFVNLNSNIIFHFKSVMWSFTSPPQFDQFIDKWLHYNQNIWIQYICSWCLSYDGKRCTSVAILKKKWINSRIQLWFKNELFYIKIIKKHKQLI